MSATAPREALATRLAARGIATTAATWSAAQRAALRDALPDRLATPRSAAELRELVLEATVAEESLLVIGGGSALACGAPPRRSALAVSMRGLDRIVDHSVADFVVTVEAGIRFATLQDELRRHRQWLAVEPPDRDEATLGGMIAAQTTSLVAAGHGTLRHHLLGLRVLYADGRFGKSGGRVVKNVAGYDLMKLHHGALGTLGIVVEATLRLRPLPECDLVTRASCRDPSALAEFGDALAQPGFAPAGGHFVGQLQSGALEGELLARFQGATSAAHAQAGALEAALTARGPWSRETLADGSHAARPRSLRDAAAAFSSHDEIDSALVSLHFAPSATAATVAALLRFGAGRVALDLVRGVGSIRLATDGAGGPLSQSLALGIVALHRDVAAHGGALFVTAGPPELRAALPDRAETAAAAALAVKLRDELDPHRRFNPDRRGP